MSKESRIQDSIEAIKKLFDLIQEHLVITDVDGKILYANTAVLKKTGFSQEEIIGQNPGKLWGGQMPKEFYVEMWDTIKNKKMPWSGEIKNVTKDGKEIWVNLQINPVLDDDGDILFFVALEPDITERKKMAENLKNKSEFLDKMSRLMVDRELKMTTLKEEADTLKEQLVSAYKGNK